MANLQFPQLSTGTLSQYPIQKTRAERSIKNVLADGSVLLFPDRNAGRFVWQLAYSGISLAEVTQLQTFFAACSGPFLGFTFIDPTENMLVASADLTAAAWQNSGQIQVTPGSGDPEGGTAAFTLTNTGQTTQQITQTLQVPCSYQYCLSAYVTSAQQSRVELVRSGTGVQVSDPFMSGPSWQRIVSAGELSDSGSAFTVGIALEPGEQIEVYGIQLEAQITPSRYRPTVQRGGVWPNAHWGNERLAISADGPDQFSTSFTIETAI